jgi:hypothetical protein
MPGLRSILATLLIAAVTLTAAPDGKLGAEGLSGLAKARRSILTLIDEAPKDSNLAHLSLWAPLICLVGVLFRDQQSQDLAELRSKILAQSQRIPWAEAMLSHRR